MSTWLCPVPWTHWTPLKKLARRWIQGATLSLFPASLLERLGIHRIGQRRLGGFGGVLVRDVGNANLTHDGDTAGVTVVFGEEREPAILGVTALETLGVQVDPVARQLHRVDMLI